MYSNIKEKPSMYGDDIFGEINETFIHAITKEQQEQIGYDQNEYEVHSIQEDGNFNQGNEAIVHAMMLEEGLTPSDGAYGFSFYDPDDEKSCFKISLREESYDIESLGVVHNDYTDMGDQANDPILSLRPEYMTKEADVVPDNICTFDRQV